jgi:hypothetical protein
LEDYLDYEHKKKLEKIKKLASEAWENSEGTDSV